MVAKWVEERWKMLFPALAPLSQAQEARIRELCETELALWRQRPGIHQLRSLQPALSHVRTSIREQIPLTDDNWWFNPKSGQKEHLALKYLNFSTEEWMTINLPREEDMRERQEHPLPLSAPLLLLERVEHLLRSTRWPELVVGIGLATGRGMVEVLHTGHFANKTAYSLLFAGPMTVYELMSDPFEVPTLVRAELVLDALSRLRTFFSDHFVGQQRRDISQQCREHVQQAAYQHLLPLVPLHPFERNLYTQLVHGVYPRLATWLYCPAEVDELLYMATIQQHRKILETPSPEERKRLALANSYLNYVLLDEHGEVDQRRGTRLGEPAVVVLACFQQRETEQAEKTMEESEAISSFPLSSYRELQREEGGASGTVFFPDETLDDRREDTIWVHEETEPEMAADFIKEATWKEIMQKHVQQNERGAISLPGKQEDGASAGNRQETAVSIDASSGKVVEENAMTSYEDELDELERFEFEWCDRFRKQELELICQERNNAFQEEKKDWEDEGIIFQVNHNVHRRITIVQQREGKRTSDGSIRVLLDAYEWFHRGGSFPRVKPRAPPMKGVSYNPEVYYVSESTYQRMRAINPDKLMSLEEILWHLLDTYEWVLEGGLARSVSRQKEQTQLFSSFESFLDAVWNEPLLRHDEVHLIFTSETDFLFTYPDGRRIYAGNAADLRFVARILFEEVLCVSPLDGIDERVGKDE